VLGKQLYALRNALAKRYERAKRATIPGPTRRSGGTRRPWPFLMRAGHRGHVIPACGGAELRARGHRVSSWNGCAWKQAGALKGLS